MDLPHIWIQYRWIVVLLLFVVAFVTYIGQSATKRTLTESGRIQHQLFVLFLVNAGILAVILSLPDPDVRKDLLGLFGLLASAAIALASSTLLGNILAGFMLRSIDNLEPGDFVRVEDKFGRVTLRGLFAVEIQTEGRDLVTIPNMLLVSKPVEVIRSSGTILNAEVSLGYDVERHDVERHLLTAAEAAGLEDPFVQILSLGDFSIVYRVSGLQKDVGRMISTRSDLHEQMIDHLHRARIEIVSPNFMNQRQIDPKATVIAKAHRGREKTNSVGAEDVAFDKADMAGSLQMLRDKHASLVDEGETLAQLCGKTEDDVERSSLEHAHKRLVARIERMAEAIAGHEANLTKIDDES